jgi:hypothetical protein
MEQTFDSEHRDVYKMSRFGPAEVKRTLLLAILQYRLDNTTDDEKGVRMYLMKFLAVPQTLR